MQSCLKNDAQRQGALSVFHWDAANEDTELGKQCGMLIATINVRQKERE